MRLSHIAFLLLLLPIVSCGDSTPDARNVDPNGNSVDGKGDKPTDTPAGTSLAVFRARILPIFEAKKPSSCTECHLSGVELADYIHPDQEKTYASLVGAGMVDVERPLESKILKFIERRPEKPNLVSEKVRRQEYEAFLAWIVAATKDPALRGANIGSPVGSRLPEAVIRHARKDRVLTSFIENIWTEVGRCASCHSPDQNRKQVREFGGQVSWIKLDDPEATMRYMIDEELIDAGQPEKSLLLMKPLMQVSHEGGQKMVVGDRTYKQFRRFIDDYSSIVRGEYTKREQLPRQSREVSVVTDIWLKIEGVPAEFDKKLLQADLYQKTDSGWSEYRVATSDRPVFGKGNLWQHSLSLCAQRGSPWADTLRSKRLPPGRYLLKVYVDRTGKLKKDSRAELDDEDLLGQVEFQSRWPTGDGRMTVLKFPSR